MRLGSIAEGESGRFDWDKHLACREITEKLDRIVDGSIGKLEEEKKGRGNMGVLFLGEIL